MVDFGDQFSSVISYPILGIGPHMKYYFDQLEKKHVS